MPFYSPNRHNHHYNYHVASNGYAEHLRKAASFGVLIAFVAVLAWAFSPLTSDANYIAIPTAKNNLNAAVAPDTPASPTANGNSGVANPAAKAKSMPTDGKAASPIIGTVAAISGASISEINKVDNPPAAVATIKSFTVKSGDTLSQIFKAAGVPLVQAIHLSRTPAAKAIHSLQPGRELRFFFNPEGQWESLEYTLDKLKTLLIKPNQDKFTVSTHEKAVVYQTVASSGTIKSSLAAAGEQADLSYNMVAKLVDIFKWEIDFARDIRVGDRFHLIYEKAFVEKEFIADGAITAVEFWNRGKAIQALRYTDKEGKIAYYRPDGESLKRGFLRTPIKLARVTSNFAKRRLHPIKKIWKAHKGVDYGAKTGTPIVATGDGIVQYAGRKGGYGNTVILRHAGSYTTLYAHMSRYGKGIRTGKRVIQGQTIGYVGSTGWATGPHLHYEFRINGHHKNPLKVEFPRTEPVAANEMAQFKRFSKQRLLQLSQATEIKTAQR